MVVNLATVMLNKDKTKKPLQLLFRMVAQNVFEQQIKYRNGCAVLQYCVTVNFLFQGLMACSKQIFGSKFIGYT